jgi:hypothetical protein
MEKKSSRLYFINLRHDGQEAYKVTSSIQYLNHNDQVCYRLVTLKPSSGRPGILKAFHLYNFIMMARYVEGLSLINFHHEARYVMTQLCYRLIIYFLHHDGPVCNSVKTTYLKHDSQVLTGYIFIPSS